MNKALLCASSCGVQLAWFILLGKVPREVYVHKLVAKEHLAEKKKSTANALSHSSSAQQHRHCHSCRQLRRHAPPPVCQRLLSLALGLQITSLWMPTQPYHPTSERPAFSWARYVCSRTHWVLSWSGGSSCLLHTHGKSVHCLSVLLTAVTNHTFEAEQSAQPMAATWMQDKAAYSMHTQRQVISDLEANGRRVLPMHYKAHH